MKINISIVSLMVILLLLISCGNRGSSIKGPDEEQLISVSPEIVFRSGSVQSSPDVVDSVRITIFFNGESRTKTFPYIDRRGTMSGIPANTAFRLRVEGIDSYGRVIYSGEREYAGSASDFAITITAAEVTPAAPSDLQLESLSSSSIRLVWNDNSSNEMGFVIQRSVADASQFVTIDSVGSSLGSSATYIDSVGLSASTTYYYRVYAFNLAGVSASLTHQGTVTGSGSAVVDTSKPVLELNQMPDTVSIAQVTISGKVYDNSGINKILINGVEVAANTADSSFEFLITLSEGQNNISIKIIDGSTRRNETNSFLTIVYDPSATDNTPPNLKIQSPSDSALFASRNITINGTVNDPGTGVASLTMNGVAITLSGINWSVSHALDQGWNELVFIAVDNRGNNTRDTLYLECDTSIADIVPPVISFGSLIANHIFSEDSVTISIRVDENGSGIDSVVINGIKCSSSGQFWSARIVLQSDVNMVRVAAVDLAGNMAHDSLPVILNRPPYFVTSASELSALNPIAIGTPFNFPLVVSEPDGTPERLFALLKAPSGFQVDIKTGVLSWNTPAAGVDLMCSVTVADKYGFKDTLAWRLYTTQDITPPTIMFSTPRNNDVVNTSAAKIIITVYDNESGVALVTINTVQAQLFAGKWQADVNLNNGLNKIALYAKDNSGNEKIDTLSVYLNSAPLFTKSQAEMKNSALAGSVYLDSVRATDADGDAVRFRLISSPGGMAIDSVVGRISWTPTTAESVWVSVEAYDVHSATDTLSWYVIVTASQVWSTVGQTGFTPMAVDEISIDISPEGYPYVCAGDSVSLTLWKNQGGNWIQAHTQPIMQSAVFSSAITFNEYSPYEHFVAAKYRSGPYVRATASSNGWNVMGSISGGSNGSLFTCYRSGAPHIAFVNYSTLMPTVIRYDGTAWTQISTPISNQRATYIKSSKDFESGTMAVVAYDTANTPGKIQTAIWRPSDSWETRFNGMSSEPLKEIAPAFDNASERIFVAYVRKSDGKIGLYEVGQGGIDKSYDSESSDNGCKYISAVYANGKVYVAYVNSSFRINVIYKNVDTGGEWNFLGPRNLTSALPWTYSYFFKLGLTVNPRNGTLYLAYPDPGSGNKLTVMRATAQ